MLQVTHDNFFLQHSYVIIALYILEQPSSLSTSRIRPSWPQSRVELRLLLLCFCEHSSCLSWPTHQRLKFHVQPFLTSRTALHQCTSKQHGYATSYVHRHAYLHHIHITIHHLVESLQSHFILTMSHWSSGPPVCFSSQGKQIQNPWGDSCETEILLLALSRYIGDPDVIDHHCGLV
jgi:hypothetical protein